MISNYIPQNTTTQARLAVIAETPTKDDLLVGEAFSSGKYKYIRALLNNAGVNSTHCLLGYIRPTPAPYGSLDSVSYGDADMMRGLEILKRQIMSYKPNCCLLLGKTALRLAGIDHALDDYRGSIFISPTFGTKCVATFDPMRGLQNGVDAALMAFDVHRAVAESSNPQFQVYSPMLLVLDDVNDVVNHLTSLDETQLLAFDIEGYPDGHGMTCISFAQDKRLAFTIPLRRKDGSSVFSREDECLSLAAYRTSS